MNCFPEPALRPDAGFICPTVPSRGAPPTAGAACPGSGGPLVPGGKARSVLVVDDEPGIRTALSAGFRRSGWRVECAGNVREAVSLLSRGRFDLVVSDMRMPDGDGTE